MNHILPLWDSYADATYAFNKRRFREIQLAIANWSLGRLKYDDDPNERLLSYILFLNPSGWGKSRSVVEALQLLGIPRSRVLDVPASSSMEAIFNGEPEEGDPEEGGGPLVSDPPALMADAMVMDEMLASIIGKNGQANTKFLAQLCTTLENGRYEWNLVKVKRGSPRPDTLGLRKRADGSFEYDFHTLFLANTAIMPEKLEELLAEMGFLNRLSIINVDIDNKTANDATDEGGPHYLSDPLVRAEKDRVAKLITQFAYCLRDCKFEEVPIPLNSLTQIVNIKSGRKRYVELCNEAGIKTTAVTAPRADADARRYITAFAVLRHVESCIQKLPDGTYECKPQIFKGLVYTPDDAIAAGEHLAPVYLQKVAQIPKQKMTSEVVIKKDWVTAVKGLINAGKVEMTPDGPSFQSSAFVGAIKGMDRFEGGRALVRMQAAGLIDRMNPKKGWNVWLGKEI